LEAAKQTLALLLPKWNPNTPPNPTTLDEWAIAIENAADKGSTTHPFKPGALVTALNDGFRVLTGKQTPSPYPATREDEPIDPEAIRVYTDGSCISNGNADAIAGSGVWYGEGDDRNLAYRLSSKHNTNNASEIMAVLLAAQKNYPDTELTIHSDSQYTMDALTKNLAKFESNGWVGVSNPSLIQATASWLRQRSAKTTFGKVKSHSGINGNEGADRLANEGARKNSVSLINLTVPAHLHTPGLKLTAATQSLLYRGLLNNQKKIARQKTAIMVEQVKLYVKDWTNSLPNNSQLWGSLRHKDIDRKIRNFLWRGLHNSLRIGEWWLNIPNCEGRSHCLECDSLESMEHIFFECQSSGQDTVW
jgi:ribonuclease HI